MTQGKNTSVTTCLVSGRVGKARYLMAAEGTWSPQIDGTPVTTSVQRPLKLGDKRSSNHDNGGGVNSREVDPDVSRYNNGVTSRSSSTTTFCCNYVPESISQKIHKSCTSVKDTCREAWLFLYEFTLWICDTYDLEVNWEKMGIRARFKAIDAVINLFLLTPLSVLFCFGTWGILDRLLLDYLPIFGCWILLIGGIAVETAVGYFQSIIREQIPKVEDEDSPVSYQPQILGFNYIIAFANVCHIRATTDLLNYYVGISAYNSFRAAFTALIILWGMKCGRNIISAPLHIGLDNDHNNYCKVSSLNNIEVSII